MSMIINGKTGLTGLLGSPVGHSKSPMMHNTSFQELGINYEQNLLKFSEWFPVVL